MNGVNINKILNSEVIMNEMMLCAVYDGSAKIQMSKKRLRTLGPGDVIIKVMACGICGTDLRILKNGHHRLTPGSTKILGHEFSGEVYMVSEGNNWLNIGMRVTVAPNIGCGYCIDCIQGNTNLCSNCVSFGVVLDGGFAEYVWIPAVAVQQGNVIEIPDGLSYAEAAFNEPLSCAYHGYMACHPLPHDNVLIVGSGPIGLCHLQLAKFLGANNVIMTDNHDSRLATAREMGADFALNPSTINLKEAVTEITKGRGVDIAIIAAASAQAQKQALELCGNHGRVNFFGGLPKDNSIIQLDANLVHYKELYITGTTGQAIHQFRTTLSMMEAGHIKIEKLVTGKFALNQAVEAIEFANSKQGLKTMIFPSK